MDEAAKYKGCHGCTKEELVTVQKFIGYNSLFYLLRNWIKIKLIMKLGSKAGYLR